MAVPKLDLQGAGLVENSLHLTRHERTHKWLQDCSAQSDSLDGTDTVFSAQTEATAPPDTLRFKSRASKGALAPNVRNSAVGYEAPDIALKDILGQVRVLTRA